MTGLRLTGVPTNRWCSARSVGAVYSAYLRRGLRAGTPSNHHPRNDGRQIAGPRLPATRLRGGATAGNSPGFKPAPPQGLRRDAEELRADLGARRVGTPPSRAATRSKYATPTNSRRTCPQVSVHRAAVAVGPAGPGRLGGATRGAQQGARDAVTRATGYTCCCRCAGCARSMADRVVLDGLDPTSHAENQVGAR